MPDHDEENIQGRDRNRFSTGNFRSTSSPGRSKNRHPPKAKGPSEEARSCVSDIVDGNADVVDHIHELHAHFDSVIRENGNRFITANVKAARASTASKAQQLLVG
ncbi:MAG: hypothetical protein WCG83_04940 [Candidatus Peregrinibacteria bacterium]